MAVRENTNNVICGLQNGELLEVDSETGEIMCEYGSIHEDPICGISVTADKCYAWTSSVDGYAKKVKLGVYTEKGWVGGEIVQEIEVGVSIGSCCLTPDKQMLFLGGWDGSIRCINLATGE